MYFSVDLLKVGGENFYYAKNSSALYSFGMSGIDLVEKWRPSMFSSIDEIMKEDNFKVLTKLDLKRIYLIKGSEFLKCGEL